jgi:hypothetical protein
MKAIYTMEQTQQVIAYLDGLALTGIDNFKRVALAASILEKPVDTIEEKEGEANECK